uniref:NADH-ubiquinone oxidoreductase subunit 4L n=1 Tax=Nyctotherus ovalis TaxID=70075 RepID=F1AAK3_NYCOV|nr:NADH-ubiquinone oxidoreductase subunit 4L [Nyctotherus ovalis]
MQLFGGFDYLTIILVVLLYLLICNGGNGVSLLILSELVWAILYLLYLFCGSLFGFLSGGTVATFLLVLAAVESSIWLLMLVYTLRCNTGAAAALRTDIKFLWRSGRLLRDNRYIK